MSKRNREQDAREENAPARGSSSGPFLPPNFVRYLTLFGVGFAVFFSARTWIDVGEFQKSIGTIDSRLSALTTKVDGLAAGRGAQQQQQRPQGPDPNKVYTIKTQGAPSEGPKNAPITIAEFSEFQ